MTRRLAILLPLLVTAVLISAQPAQNYFFLRSSEGVPVFGSGIRPTVTGGMGIPIGTPFYDTSTYTLYYWSGSAWAANFAIGSSVDFEGATVDDFETSISAVDPTADNTINIPNATGTLVLYGSAATTIPSNGGGTPAAYTSAVTPRSRLFFIEFTCNDTDGCDITMGETSVENGQEVVLTNKGANVCNFADTAGVTELTGALAMGQYDSLRLVYSTDRWVETGRSDN